MELIFDPEVSAAYVERIRSIDENSERQWGKLDAAGMFSHCSLVLEPALADKDLKWSIPGRLFAWMIKRKLVSTDAPFSQNSPTDPSLIASDASDLEGERERLLAAVQEFSSRGLTGMPKGPHPFFGRLTAEQWALLMTKHLDHHLRQFGA